MLLILRAANVGCHMQMKIAKMYCSGFLNADIMTAAKA